MKKNKFLLSALVLTLILSCCALFACQAQPEGEYTITVENSLYGGATVQKSANAGDMVELKTFGNKGYEACEVYVNGQRIEENQFVMPSENVTVKVALASTASTAHAVTVEGNEDGVIVADLVSANAGDLVTLNAYSSYNRKVDYFTVNGEKINGNSFNMPESAVTINAVFVPVYGDTNVKLGLTVSYQQATSYWYAEYTENAINASLKLESNRLINFTFLNNNGRLVLKVENNYNGIIELDNENNPTNHEENHGIGTASIQYFAKRNDLIIDYEITQNIFKIIILFK